MSGAIASISTYSPVGYGSSCMNTAWDIVLQRSTAMHVPLAILHYQLTVPDPPEVVLLMEHLENSPVTATEIRKTTARDPGLAHVLQNVQSGWPD